MSRPVLSLMYAPTPSAACRAAALPDDGVIHGLARRPVPDQAGLALVRDAYGRYILRRDAALLEGLRQRAYLRAEDVRRVMLDPAGAGVYLRVVVLSYRDYLTRAGEHYGARARPGPGL